jgi:hypothetical protein
VFGVKRKYWSYGELAKLSDEGVMARLQLGKHEALGVLFDPLGS